MTKEQLYKKYAKFYDKIYHHKDYKNETDFLKKICKKFKVSGNNLLDVACGTGTHAKLLSESGFNVSAIDASSEMIKIAKTKTKNAFFKEGFMQSFKFTKKFDVILCLFTSINYNPKKEALKKTLLNFYNHCSEGGIVIFDLGIIKGQEKEKEGVFIHTYSKENLEIARINQWKPSKKKKDVFDANSLIFIKENGRIDFEIDEHELSLFSVEEIKLIMKKLGFKVEMYEDFNLKKYVDKSKRVIFVGQK